MATLQIVLLPRTIPPVYRSFVGKELREDSSLGMGYLAIGVQFGEEPVGIGILSYSGESRDRLTSAMVHKLEVVPVWQGRGVGTHLLATLEEEAAKQGASGISCTYSTEWANAPALERVLAKQHWSLPTRLMVLAQITTAMFAQTEWMRHWQVPPEFTIFPWETLSAADEAYLQTIQSEVPPELWPFRQGGTPEPSGCIGLRDAAGHVIGWMVMHRVEPDVVRYTALYVHPRPRRAQITFALLAEAIRRQVAACGPHVRGSMAVLEENRRMIRVLERHFRPFASHWNELRSSGKDLHTL